ncbi:hypothetical protein [Mycolicibacterium holsaticum]|nr:hypothetical protein [Mycolicibacterium holsaticum]MDA4110180.1 hypothetical protein [Mycolicibacterium holsaticum DSM 44478 = JCM 12374]QZA11916.1 hypothetical protein K3U96_22585 [Mycolicibacterium holsaticum DSM 44478 = JCM 12374]UNC10596.1 hypothetical protein H5U41_04230 [Mycolicibacterium holsaticum DSM 44478 = JCM 12374]
MLLNPDSWDLFETYEADAWQDHRACTWAQLRWSGIPAEIVDYARRVTL